MTSELVNAAQKSPTHSQLPKIDETTPLVIRHYTGQLERGTVYIRGQMALNDLVVRTAAEFYIIHAFDGKVYAGKTGAEAVEKYLNLQSDDFSEKCYRQYFEDTIYPPLSITVHDHSTVSYYQPRKN